MTEKRHASPVDHRPDLPKPTADIEVLRRISAGDPQASAAFVATVLDRACELVQEALAGRGSQQSSALSRLIRAYQRDDLQLQAALISAQTTFHRYLLDLSRSAEIRDDRDYVAALITLTYNRWSRQHYGDKRIWQQTALGAATINGIESTSLLANAVDPGPGPEFLPDLSDFYEKLREEVHLLCSGLRPGEAEIVYLRLFQEMTYEQIAREVNRPIAGVHRICQQVVAHLRGRFRDIAR